MKNLKHLLVAIICMFILSCKKSGDFLYTDIARIQFGPEPRLLYSTAAGLNDSLKRQTFVYLDNSTLIDTIYFDIYAMGNLSDKDRSFTLKQEQVNEEYNAVPGVHYKAFTDSDVAGNYVIKAGQSHNLVPVILMRDASLKSNSAILKFSIVANENFQPGPEELLWRKVIFTDRISRPSAWNESVSTMYFGKYSEVKHKFMIKTTGQKWDQDFFVMLIQDTQQLQYWLGMVKSALVAYNNDHPDKHMTDEFEEPVVIP